MSRALTDFSYSDQLEPHKLRTREIIKKHPEIREFIGKNHLSAILILLIVGFQISVSFLMTGLWWWITLPAAYFIGAFANHSLFVLIHECAHNLIFKSRALNQFFSILADIPNTIPSAISFRSYHLKHHAFMGDYYMDADLASRWEAKIIGSSFIGKSLWLLFFPVFQGLRPPRLKEIKFLNWWTLLNWFIVFGGDFLIIYFWGWNSILYLFLSFFFSIGFHPLGARWIQEHYLTFPPQETYSYYGPLNSVALNVGYHNEHHDFPSIPWSRLPKVKASAPEYYENLKYHPSWFRLWIRFLTDKNLSLFSRMTRSRRDSTDDI